MKETTTQVGKINVIDLYSDEGKVLVKPILNSNGVYILDGKRYDLVESTHAVPVYGVDKSKFKEVKDVLEFCKRYGYVYDPVVVQDTEIFEEEVIADVNK